MNHSGDAAEQIVRMSLEGVEVAARITGNAAKEIAFLLIAALKSPDKKGGNLKLKGAARMSAMLKSGKALEIYSVKESDLKKFYQAAKQYGIVYCVLRNSKNTPDGLCDIMVKAEDAPKINRIAERFKFATVDRAKIESEIVAAKGERTEDTELEAPDINDTDKLLVDFMGEDEGKAESEPDREQPEIPLANGGQTQESRQSAPTSESRSKSEKDIFDNVNENERRPSSSSWNFRPSVKEELREIKAAKKASEAEAPKLDEPIADKPKANPATTHKQPKRGKKNKSKKSKER